MSGEHIAIHAAAHLSAYEVNKHLELEEEMMTDYTQEDLNKDWEFKIVRSASGAFKRPEFMAEVLDEAAVSGWELVEKFDDNRLRLKRSAEARRKDDFLPGGIDPYRTQYGIGENRIAMLWLLLAFGIAAGVIVGIIMAAAA